MAEDSEQTQQLPDGDEGWPTPFQKKIGWFALTGFNCFVIGALGIALIVVLNWTLSFLQPILVPVAIAGILAYLLEPIIFWLQKRWGWSDRKSVLTVYIGFNLIGLGLLVFVIFQAVDQAIQIAQPEKIQEMSQKIGDFSQTQLDKLEDNFPGFKGAREWMTDGRGAEWAKRAFAPMGDALLKGSLGKLFSFLGYVFGLILVPVYLYYFLTNSTSIARKWSDYLPLWESDFKDEVVDVLKEINGYIIAYFRGQMVVSIIDGVLVTIALLIMGLDYAILIGVFLAILGLIPYIGNLLVLIPAVLISIAQFSSYENAWIYPLIVIAIFLVLQQVNGLITAPKIVGDSVGLHPLTVIFSMLFWALILGGLLGALLAVPLTASVKVLFRRYVWKKRLQPNVRKRLNLKDPPANRSTKRKRQSKKAKG